MPYVAYNRPISKVGHRLLDQTRPAHAAALSGIGTLGDDSTQLAVYGFTSAEIAQIISAHNAGALSDAGYQQLVSGTVDPSQLADFLNADLGAAATPWISQAAGIPNWGLLAIAGIILVLGFTGGYQSPRVKVYPWKR